MWLIFGSTKILAKYGQKSNFSPKLCIGVFHIVKQFIQFAWCSAKLSAVKLTSNLSSTYVLQASKLSFLFRDSCLLQALPHCTAKQLLSNHGCAELFSPVFTISTFNYFSSYSGHWKLCAADWVTYLLCESHEFYHLCLLKLVLMLGILWSFLLVILQSHSPKKFQQLTKVAFSNSWRSNHEIFFKCWKWELFNRTVIREQLHCS